MAPPRITRLPPQILEHWACCKLVACPDMADEDLRDLLVAKLSMSRAVRYAAVAARAEALGRRSLAALLLDQERMASEQVPLLLGLQEYQRCAATRSRPTQHFKLKHSPRLPNAWLLRIG